MTDQLGVYEQAVMQGSGFYESTNLSVEQQRRLRATREPDGLVAGSASVPGVDDEQYTAWVARHGQLALLNVRGAISKEQRHELRLLRWMLDTAEERAQDPFGLLSDFVRERQRLAREIANFVKSTQDLASSRRGR